MLLLGMALQRGLLGVSVASLERAIELNGTKLEFNKCALALGRLCAHDLAAARAAAGGATTVAKTDNWQALVERRAAFLVNYQDAAYAQRLRDLVGRVALREAAVTGRAGGLAAAVANSYFKLLAYKDEYEVARLWTDPASRARLGEMFEPGYRLRLSLAPQLPWIKGAAGGRLKKRLWGPWILSVFRLLAAMRRLRGTPLDFVGYHPHRRRERALIGSYERTIEGVLSKLTSQNHAIAVEIARVPESIRGYGVVKERNMADAARRQAELLQQFDLVTSSPRDSVANAAA
jgi:indolepyruvate ferredoxin oxidoreductase